PSHGANGCSYVDGHPPPRPSVAVALAGTASAAASAASTSSRAPTLPFDIDALPSAVGRYRRSVAAGGALRHPPSASSRTRSLALGRLEVREREPQPGDGVRAPDGLGVRSRVEPEEVRDAGGGELTMQ